jgi:hypothetical protein
MLWIVSRGEVKQKGSNGFDCGYAEIIGHHDILSFNVVKLCCGNIALLSMGDGTLVLGFKSLIGQVQVLASCKGRTELKIRSKTLLLLWNIRPIPGCESRIVDQLDEQFVHHDIIEVRRLINRYCCVWCCYGITAKPSI